MSDTTQEPHPHPDRTADDHAAQAEERLKAMQARAERMRLEAEARREAAAKGQKPG